MRLARIKRKERSLVRYGKRHQHRWIRTALDLPKQRCCQMGVKHMGGSYRLSSLAVVVTAAVSSSSADAQVLMQRDVSLRVALAIAETSIAECEKSGNSVS